jgi:hypothetical protein
MIVYVVCGHVYDDSICEYTNPIVGVFKDEKAAKSAAAQHEITDKKNVLSTPHDTIHVHRENASDWKSVG